MSLRKIIGGIGALLLGFGIYMLPFGYEEFRYFIKYTFLGGDEVTTIWFMYAFTILCIVLGIALVVYAYKKMPPQVREVKRDTKKVLRRLR